MSLVISCQGPVEKIVPSICRLMIREWKSNELVICISEFKWQFISSMFLKLTVRFDSAEISLKLKLRINQIHLIELAFIRCIDEFNLLIIILQL